MQARVIQSTGSFYDVLTETGATVQCRLKGKMRLSGKKQTNPVAVGDVVEVETDERGNDVIAEVLPRKNYIVRSDPHKKEFKNVIAANIDRTIIIASLTKPRTSYGFIDRILLTSEVYDIPACIIFNKYDLYGADEKELMKELMFAYKDAGYTSMYTSAITGLHLDQLHDLLHNSTSLLTGHSGVGKSTLVNAVDPSLDLRVREISEFTEKGQHTTTFAHMYGLTDGGFIIDTPGIKEFGVVDIEAYEVSHYFPEMRRHMGKCRFNNCLHINEDGCYIKDLLEEGKFSPTRYNSYITLYNEISEAEKW